MPSCFPVDTKSLRNSSIGISHSGIKLEVKEEIFIKEKVWIQNILILKVKGSQGRLRRGETADCAGTLAKGPWIKNKLGLQR